jgi:hypothetical protein
VDYVVDSKTGDPLPHPTKPGQLARNGGQIPIVDPETKLPRSYLPGDVFEVDKVIAEDLLATHAQTGLVVLESEYQKRKIRFETARAADDAERYALAGVYQSQEAQKIAARKLAAQVRRQRRADLAEEEAAPAAVDIAALVAAEVARVREETAAQIASLQAQLAQRAAVPEVKEEAASTAAADKEPAKDERKKGGK